MIDRHKLEPGVWIVQNLIRHQNDYIVRRIDRVEKSMTYFNKSISFSLYSSNEPMKARIGMGLDIPTWSITSRPAFSLLKNAKKKYKRLIIKAILKG